MREANPDKRACMFCGHTETPGREGAEGSRKAPNTIPIEEGMAMSPDYREKRRPWRRQGGLEQRSLPSPTRTWHVTRPTSGAVESRASPLESRYDLGEQNAG